MRIYNRKKRAISLVMAIMVMSSSIQITGLAEGEKEEGKKIIISEFQELPEDKLLSLLFYIMYSLERV